MNEAFEKILERLEEYEYEHLVGHDSEMANHCKQDCNDVNDCTLCVWDKAIEIVKQEAEKFGTDINVVSNGWIPCSEKLPEEYGDYLVWWTDITRKQYYEIAEYEPNNGWIGEIPQAVKGKYSVIAWQPLPEPYKESD